LRRCDSTDAPPAAQRSRESAVTGAPPTPRRHPARSRGWHNSHRVSASIGPLLPLFERERRAGRALVLGVLVHTSGSTYQKPGALILITQSGEYAGLLSGGCLESDLREHAAQILADGAPRIVRYELRGPEELLWGLGLGCEGAMRILLLRVGPANAWQPLESLRAALEARRPPTVALACESTRADVPLGTVVFAGDPGRLPEECAGARLQAALNEAAREAHCAWHLSEAREVSWFLLSLGLPPRLLLLGAGPDAAPVAEFATRLDWKVTLVDHRPAYANPEHFPGAERVLRVDPAELGAALELDRFHAAVVMSHHLPSDLAYLRALAGSDVPYVGLLGPAQRRDRLLSELGSEAARLRRRLHAPVGLPLGGRTPEAIALAIVAELQSFLHPQQASAPIPARLAAAE
jgi:xanthine dehydrogenase accessory factor